MWWRIVVSAVSALLVLWVLLIAVLWRMKPDESRLAEALRLLPDLVRLVSRLARDSSLPRGVRVRLWLLLAYLASPVDLVPDFIPVLGYADDAVLVALTLRSVVQRAGEEPLARHWPGTADGLAVVRRVALGAGQASTSATAL